MRDGMNGKVCLITGGTGGIGAVAARELAARGAVAVIVGRDAARTAGAAHRIAGLAGGTVIPMHADLSLQSEVRRLAAEFRSKFPRLGVLINNAGAMYEYRRVTAEGIEATFALNHLGPFLLTNLLLDML